MSAVHTTILNRASPIDVTYEPEVEWRRYSLEVEGVFQDARNSETDIANILQSKVCPLVQK
jgi:hypothetical protein